jgi:hypothetical protein
MSHALLAVLLAATALAMAAIPRLEPARSSP